MADEHEQIRKHNKKKRRNRVRGKRVRPDMKKRFLLTVKSLDILDRREGILRLKISWSSESKTWRRK